MATTNQPTEIAIINGGMVGGALVLGLTQHGLTVTVIGHAQPAPFVVDSQPDVWISAISAASVSLLKGVGVQDAVQVMRYHPYRRLETWEWGTARVVFDAAELKLPLLGYMVENTVPQRALQRALEAHPKVTLRVPDSLTALYRHGDLQEPELKGDEAILVKLVIGADGADSQARQMAGTGVRAWQYAQSCMLTSVQYENDPGNSTWQQFIPDEPCAFLSLFDNWTSLVWYDFPARICRSQNMNTAQLQAKIVKHFPSRLGCIIPLATGTFPPIRRHALQYVQPGLALAGDTVHTIHSPAGQGVNLGYRDVDALIDVLVNARSYSKTWASYPVFKRYQMRHMADNFMMQNGINLFYVGFSNNLPSLRSMRNLGSVTAKRAGVLKRQALKYVLGL